MSASDRGAHDLWSALAAITDGLSPEEAAAQFCTDLAGMIGALAVTVAALDEQQQPWLQAGTEGRLGDLGRQQFELGEGPCVDASRGGQPVWARCEAAVARWPRWAPHALEAGVDGVVSLPISHDGQPRPLGTVWMAFGAAEWHEDRLLQVASNAAVIALRSLSSQHELEQRRVQVAQLEHALQSRVVIEQAKGYLAARDGVDPDEAFQRLRQRARSSQRRLRDLAAEVLREGNLLSA